jgi:hypothetical protein
MKAEGYILTGLRKMRNGSHSPIIVDYGFTAARLDPDAAADRLPTYEHFNVFPATKAVIAQLAQAAANDRRRLLAVEDFSVWPQDRSNGGLIVCTEKDRLMARLVAAVASGKFLPVRKPALVSKEIARKLVFPLLVLALAVGVLAAAQHEGRGDAATAGSSFTYDESAPPVYASNFAYDPDSTTAVRASAFIYTTK